MLYFHSNSGSRVNNTHTDKHTEIWQPQLQPATERSGRYSCKSFKSRTNKQQRGGLTPALHFSFTCSCTLSRSALSCQCNPRAALASLPDTQAVFGNTKPWITCSRLHTCAHTIASGDIPALPWPRFDQAHLKVLKKGEGSPDLEWGRAGFSLSGYHESIMKHGSDFLIALRITRVRI